MLAESLIWLAAGGDTHVSSDAARWIALAVAGRCPYAVRVRRRVPRAWATDAPDEVRRQAWRDAYALARTEPDAVAGVRRPA